MDPAKDYQQFLTAPTPPSPPHLWSRRYFVKSLSSVFFHVHKHLIAHLALFHAVGFSSQGS